MTRYPTVHLLVLMAVLSPCAALAQDSRVEAIEQAQTEKARDVQPYQPNAAERLLARVEHDFFGPAVGPYPWFGSVLSGGGFALGPGYRRPFGTTGVFDLNAGWSIKNYKMVNAHLELPEVADGLLKFEIHSRWVDAPQVSFYGVGNDTVKASRTSFDYEPFTVALNAALRPVRFVEAGGGLDYVKVNTGSGSRDPSIEEGFTEATAPGLGLDAKYLRARVYGQIDSRDAPGYTRRGTLLRAEFSDYQQDGDGYNFRRVDVDARQFVPVLRENWVFAFRALLSFTDAASGEDVPYFMMPTLGGGSDLRSYTSFRFRDRNRMLLSAEYRWTPSHFLDMAFFYDAGKVAADRSDLDFNGLKRSYGVGARFHTLDANVLRIEYARGDEGGRIIFAAGPSF